MGKVDIFSNNFQFCVRHSSPEVHTHSVSKQTPNNSAQSFARLKFYFTPVPDWIAYYTLPSSALPKNGLPEFRQELYIQIKEYSS